MAASGRITVVVVSYNHRRYLKDCIEALERAGRPPGGLRLIIVDNASSDGTADFVRTHLLNAAGTATRGGLPARFIANDKNLGFSGGNNQALHMAGEEGDEFGYLLNPDTEVDPGFLSEALAVAAVDARIGMVQSLLVRHPQPGSPASLVNTWGNVQHFLGFGYAAGDGTPLGSPIAVAHMAQSRDISYASGAGVLLRMTALRQIGLLNEELFAYHEDLELGFRARLCGWRVVTAPASRVSHKYEFSRNTAKYYFMERNRFLVLLWYYRAATLLLILPALAIMELGLLGFAFMAGWGLEKLRAYSYFLSPSRWPRIWEGRRRVQHLRRTTDRDVMALFIAGIEFPSLNPWPLTHVANPAFRVYWKIARALMWW